MPSFLIPIGSLFAPEWAKQSSNSSRYRLYEGRKEFHLILAEALLSAYI